MAHKIVRDVRNYCRKRKHQEDCAFSLYNAFDVGANAYVLCRATSEHNQEVKDAGEFLTLESHKRFSKLKKVGMELFDLASIRSAAAKRVLEILKEVKKTILGKTNATDSSKGGRGKKRRVKNIMPKRRPQRLK